MDRWKLILGWAFNDWSSCRALDGVIPCHFLKARVNTPGELYLYWATISATLRLLLARSKAARVSRGHWDYPENVTAWAVAAGIINESIQNDLIEQPKDNLGEALSQVHVIRESITNVLKPLAFDEQPPSSAIEAFKKLHRKAAGHRYLDSNEYYWMWDDPHVLSETLHPVIWNAAHVLTDLDHTRLGHCPSCHWIFHDTTRNRSRKWCDMQDCGSRNKALRYYHRSKSTDDS